MVMFSLFRFAITFVLTLVMVFMMMLGAIGISNAGDNIKHRLEVRKKK